MKKSNHFRFVLLLSFTLIIQTGCNPPATATPTHMLTLQTDTPSPPSARSMPNVRRFLIEVKSSSDWTDLRIPDHEMIQSAELVEVLGNPSSYDVTEAGIGLNQSLEDAQNRVSVSVSGQYQIGSADQVEFTLEKGCLGATSIRISHLELDGYSMLFEYVHQATETSSGCEQIQFVLDIPELTVERIFDESEPVEIEYSLGEDSSYLQGAQMFDEQRAFEHIEFLASDELQGRLIGSPGNLVAGNYIAEFFEEYGLQPAGTNSSYFQPFTTTMIRPVFRPLLAITGPTTHTYTVHSEFIPSFGIRLGSGEVSSQVIWLGRCSSSDFSSSLAGQVVLCGPKSEVNIQGAVTTALQFNIGGLLLYTENDGPYPRSGYGWGELIDIPAFTVGIGILEDLLAESPYGLRELDLDLVPYELPVTVSMRSSFESVQVQGRNVLGLLPGTDPTLQDEYVIIGAHYDHVGTDPDGTIYNGANDNASGTALVMEIVRLWQSQGIQPARSVVFAAWDGEEVGLKGARYYTSDPMFPLGNTVAYLNADCVGVGEILYMYGEGAVVDQFKLSASYLDIPVELRPQALGDDHAFVDEGVTSGGIMAFLEDGGFYPELHRPEDDPEIIQLELMWSAGIVFAHSLYTSSMGY